MQALGLALLLISMAGSFAMMGARDGSAAQELAAVLCVGGIMALWGLVLFAN